MFKVLTPVFALIIAVGLVLTYVKPQFAEIKDLQSEVAEYNDALEKANELRGIISEQLNTISKYSPVDLERLEVLLPQETKEVSVVLDLDALAKTHAIELSSIAMGERTEPEARTPEPTVYLDEMGVERQVTTSKLAPQDSIVSRDISFTIKGSYDQFKAFMEDLERSLVFFDVQSLSFGEPDQVGDMTFNLTIKTYSFAKQKSI